LSRAIVKLYRYARVADAMRRIIASADSYRVKLPTIEKRYLEEEEEEEEAFTLNSADEYEYGRSNFLHSRFHISLYPAEDRIRERSRERLGLP